MTKQDILIIHGTDYKEMAKQILTRADVAALIGDRDKQVALKPNLASANAPSTGATTHPQLLAGAIEYLQEHGFHHISVIEGAWVGDRTDLAARAAGCDKVCRAYNVPFYDLQKDSWKEYVSSPATTATR